MAKTCDFAGWVTKNDLLCSDGRTIRRDAFKDCDGIEVPLVYHHDHSDPTNILGKVLLENRPEGVYGYGYFNDTEKAQHSKEAVRHGDIKYLSIYANKLKQNAGDVLHGMIREVSLVMTGANPGAKIETAFGHAEEFDEEAVITTGEMLMFEDEEKLSHADEAPAEDVKEEKQNTEKSDDNETIEDVFNTLTEKQKKAVYALIGLAIQDKEAKHEDEEGEDSMKYNAFENQNQVAPAKNYISHDDFKTILSDAKRCGSLKDAVLAHMEDEDGVLYHAFPDGGVPTTGMTVSTDEQQYMVNQPSFLFPEYKSLNNPPEWIKRDTGWVSKVMGKVGHTPFSRIKSVFADITEDEARAKGYMKTHLKTEEVFSLLKRTTDPQTIYKKQKMDRDDVIDITDFDVVAWLRGEMRMMLEEEIARAALIGDGRLSSSDDKIQESHIRPILTDSELFTIRTVAKFNESDDDIALAQAKGKALIRAAIKARKDYKGSGNPIFYTTEDVLSDLLLMEDEIGHLLYTSEAALATALRVSRIVTVPVMENLTTAFPTGTGTQTESLPVAGIIVNPTDYTIGADKGGAISMFDDFDIDYNQQKYLIETRCSGALVRPKSAIVIGLTEVEVTP